MPIYQPSEDSYILSETLERYLVSLINNIKKNNQGELINRSLTNYKPSQNIVNINDIKSIKILDMGSGSGIQAETCKKLGFNNIITADINPEAVKHLKQQGFKSIKTDLFSDINKKNKKQKFDLIIFNPPYLPEDKLEPKDSKQATTAGKQGYELIIKFLKQAKQHLNQQGVILLLFSSLSQPLIIKKQTQVLGYNLKLLNKQKLFFEELYVYKMKLTN